MRTPRHRADLRGRTRALLVAFGLCLLTSTAAGAEPPPIDVEVDPVRLRQSLDWLLHPPQGKALLREANAAFLAAPDSADLGRLWQLALRHAPETTPNDADNCTTQIAALESLQQRNPLLIWPTEALARCHRESGNEQRARHQDAIRQALIRYALRSGRGVMVHEPIRLYTPRDVQPLLDAQGWERVYSSPTAVSAVLEILVRERGSDRQRLLYLDAVSAPLATVPVAERAVAWQRVVNALDPVSASLYVDGSVRSHSGSRDALAQLRTDSGDLGAAVPMIRHCLSQPQLACAGEAVQRANRLADLEIGTVSAALSFAYAEGRGIGADADRAGDWQRKAEAQLGRASAVWELCRLSLLAARASGHSRPACMADAVATGHLEASRRDAISSRDWRRLERFAQEGSAISQAALGTQLDANRDPSGIEWLRQSARQGDLLGSYSLIEALFNPERPFLEADELFWHSEFVAQNHAWGWTPRFTLTTTLLYRGHRELSFGRPESAAAWFAECHDVDDNCLVEWFGIAIGLPVPSDWRQRILGTVDRLGQGGHAAARALTQALDSRSKPEWPNAPEIDRLRGNIGGSVVGPLLLAEALIASGKHSEAIEVLTRCETTLRRCASLQAYLRSRVNPADPESLLNAALKAARIGSPRYLAAYAKYVCTLPQYEHRDGPFGLALSLRAAEAQPEAAILGVLAACLAENEYFDEAVRVQRRALALLPRESAETRSAMEAALRDYEAGDYLILKANVGSLDDRPWPLMRAPTSAAPND